MLVASRFKHLVLSIPTHWTSGDNDPQLTIYNILQYYIIYAIYIYYIIHTLYLICCAMLNHQHPRFLPFFFRFQYLSPRCVFPLTQHVAREPSKDSPSESSTGHWKLYEDRHNKPGWICTTENLGSNLL
jgi:hypothetical protein